MIKGYTSKPISFYRKMVRASAEVSAKNPMIHSVTQADVTLPRKLIREHYKQTGEKISFTGYIVYCLAQVLNQHPELNSFIRRNRLVVLDDVTISVIVEREFDGEMAPEPAVIHAAQNLTLHQVNDAIRKAQKNQGRKMGELSGNSWINWIPGFLLKTVVSFADRNIKMAKRYGKVAVTAVGMFSKEPVWFLPHGGGTVLITVGSIEEKELVVEGRNEKREYLCITGSFNHNILDGAPAARFMNQFIETLKSGIGLELLASV